MGKNLENKEFFWEKVIDKEFEIKEYIKNAVKLEFKDVNLNDSEFIKPWESEKLTIFLKLNISNNGIIMKIGIGIKFDKESSSLPNKEPNLEIGSVTNNREEQFFCSNNILSLFNESKITPSEIIIDLLNLGIAVYTTDQLVSRNKYGYYHWNRYFELCLPVFDLAKWQAIGENLSETLSFLSGDRWIIYF